MTMVLEPVEREHQTAVATAPEARERWSLTTRVAFRFFALYFAFYILLTQMFEALFNGPGATGWTPEHTWTVTSLVTWVARSVLGFPPLFAGPSGSGDKPYDYAFAFTFLVISATLTLIWSIADRKRLAYPGLHKWYRLFLRWALGATMLVYGTIKALPSQMPFPSLSRLLEPYGQFSLMGVLWAQIGASPSYQVFIGTVEVLCAVLLFIPGLTTIAALMTLVTVSNVFLVNMTYDVPVKLFSFHLILMSLMLLAPDMKRIARVLLMRRAVDAAPERPLVRSRRLHVALVAMQIVFGAWLMYDGFSSVAQGRATFGANAPKPPLYGIWDVTRMSIDGVERAPLITDYDRWRRLVIQNAAQVRVQRMDDTMSIFPGRVDAAAKAIIFTRGQAPNQTEVGRFTFSQPDAQTLLAEGVLNGVKHRIEARLVDHTQFQLLKSGFRWMQDVPFNR
jgi:hypothetical protein